MENVILILVIITFTITLAISVFNIIKQIRENVDVEEVPEKFLLGLQINVNFSVLKKTNSDVIE